jgi:hypothetical protein
MQPTATLPAVSNCCLNAAKLLGHPHSPPTHLESRWQLWHCQPGDSCLQVHLHHSLTSTHPQVHAMPAALVLHTHSATASSLAGEATAGQCGCSQALPSPGPGDTPHLQLQPTRPRQALSHSCHTATTPTAPVSAQGCLPPLYVQQVPGTSPVGHPQEPPQPARGSRRRLSQQCAALTWCVVSLRASEVVSLPRRLGWGLLAAAGNVDPPPCECAPGGADNHARLLSGLRHLL